MNIEVSLYIRDLNVKQIRRSQTSGDSKLQAFRPIESGVCASGEVMVQTMYSGGKAREGKGVAYDLGSTG